MDWGLSAKIKSLRKEIEEGAKIIRSIKMFQKIAENEEYLKWLVERYEYLISIADNFEIPDKFRDECAKRAREVEMIYTEIATKLNEGEELSDPRSLRSRILQYRFQELRTAYAVAKNEGGIQE